MFFMIYKTKLHFHLMCRLKQCSHSKSQGPVLHYCLYSFLLACTGCAVVEQILQDTEQAAMSNNALKCNLTASPHKLFTRT